MQSFGFHAIQLATLFSIQITFLGKLITLLGTQQALNMRRASHAVRQTQFGEHQIRQTVKPIRQTQYVYTPSGAGYSVRCRPPGELGASRGYLPSVVISRDKRKTSNTYTLFNCQ